ncbi:MAG TPA: YciI family protein [Burkholderiales bacterium]|nr:YciI family protein [Burkholderiales bacterium]
MQYMLLIYSNEKQMQARSKPETEATIAAYTAYGEALRKAGVMVGGNRLKPSEAATTVRAGNGKTQVLNGPYAETREQLGGYFMIEAPDLDAAISWAARCPGASHGTVEVRPIWTM